MKTSTYKRLVAFLPLAALCIGSLNAVADTPSKMENMSHDHMDSGSSEMMKSMNKGMGDMKNMEMSGDVDKDFAMMMKLHHQQAIEMSKVELEHGKSPEMKAMAKKLITTQKAEIEKFQQWLSKK